MITLIPAGVYANGIIGGGAKMSGGAIFAASGSCTMPSAPTAISSSVTGSTLTPTWTAGTNSTSSNVSWGLTSSYGTTITGDTSGTAITGLSASTLYHFKVTAVNSCGSTDSVDQTNTTSGTLLATMLPTSQDFGSLVAVANTLYISSYTGVTSNLAAVQTQGTGTDSGNPSIILASKVTTTVAKSLQSISVYIAATSTNGMVLGIYSDNSGVPGNLLGTTQEFAPSAIGWKNMIIVSDATGTPAPLALAASTSYWLVWESEDGNAGIASSNSGDMKYVVHTYSYVYPFLESSLGTAFGTATDYPNNTDSIYGILQ